MSDDPRLERKRPTDADLDRYAEITESDLDAAVETFEKYAPVEARKILDAEPVDGPTS